MGSDAVGDKPSVHYDTECPLLRGLEYIEVYGDMIWMIRIVCYIAGVRGGSRASNLGGG